MQTFGSVLDRHKGIGPGFDFMRVALAMSILFTHAFLIAQGERNQFGKPVLALFHDSLVMGFFGLSGFLITGSALRLKLKDFILNRSLRIFPALGVDILFSALILGPIFTSFSLSRYFKSYEFVAYFANLLTVIHYTLPGVFLKNPFPTVVNGSLWTVPFEFGCYALMSILMLTGVLRQRLAAVIITVAIGTGTLALALTNFDPLITILPHAIGLHNLLTHYFSQIGTPLYTYFMAGSLIFLFRQSIPYSRWGLAFTAVVATLIDAAVRRSLGQATTTLLLAPMVMYVVIGLGLTPLPKLPLFSKGDYSYGIYLYGFPFQQAIRQLLPLGGSPWLNFAISAPLVTLVAMASWHIVEKPILSLRKRFSFTAQKGDKRQALPDVQAIVGEADRKRHQILNAPAKAAALGRTPPGQAARGL